MSSIGSGGLLACPRCRGVLEEVAGGLSCEECGRVAYLVSDVPCFTDLDDFYEGVWSHTVRLPARRRALRTVMSHFQYYGVTRFLSQRVAGGDNLILDLGCGGGQEVLTTRGQVVGVDLSRRSLVEAAQVYDAVLAADAKHLPFADGTFDYVVSVFLLEHFAGAEKDRVLAEMARVLKPGGSLVAYTDTDSDKWVIRWAKKDPWLYKRCFVDKAGHVGLEKSSALVRRFDTIGLVGIESKPKNASNVMYPMSWVAWFDNDYRARSHALRLVVRLSKWILAHKRLNQLIECGVLTVNDIADHVLPPEYATHALLTARKPNCDSAV